MYVTPDSNYTKCILGHQNILNDFRFHQNYTNIKGKRKECYCMEVNRRKQLPSTNNILNYIRNNNNKML